MGIPLCIICCFSLAAFNICSLCLIFVNLINYVNVSWGVSPWVYPVWDSMGFLDLCDDFLPHSREVFNYYLLEYFLMAFLSSSSGTPMIRMLGRFTLSQRSLRLSSFLLIFFSSLLHLFLPFYLLPHLSYLLSQLYSTAGSLQSVFDLSYCIIHY